MEHYRFEDSEMECGVYVSLTVFHMVKETPCGYWLNWIGCQQPGRKPDRAYGDIWVSKTSGKRHAYPTREEAYSSFLYRKRMQVKILTSRLERAKSALELGRENKEKLLSGQVAIREDANQLFVKLMAVPD